jgi:DHA1 family bicyclomycin/chloramphenicol resistance-like MFS transporter
MPETLKQPLAEKFSLPAMLREFWMLLSDIRFRPFAILAAATFSGLFSFISGSSFIYQLYFKTSPFAFALAFAIMTIGYVTGAFTAQGLAFRVAPRNLLLIGAVLQAVSGVAMLILVVFAAPSPWSITIPIAFYGAGVGYSIPQSQAGAMMPFPERAGAASSLLGIVQVGAAALAGAAVGALIDQGPIILAGAVALFGIISLLVQPMIRRAISARTAG